MTTDAPCTANWLGLHGQYGLVLNPICVGCARRTFKGAADTWMIMTVLKNGACDHRIERELAWGEYDERDDLR